MKPENLKFANILLVEDSDADADFFMEFFERRRLCNKVTRVKSYEGAWLHIESGEKFDVLVVDICIPGNGGLELITRVRAIPGYKRVPIILHFGQ